MWIIIFNCLCILCIIFIVNCYVISVGNVWLRKVNFWEVDLILRMFRNEKKFEFIVLIIKVKIKMNFLR